MDVMGRFVEIVEDARDQVDLYRMIQIAVILDAKYPNLPQGLRMLADDLEREFPRSSPNPADQESDGQ